MKWTGRHARRMRDMTLLAYGTTCHLCRQPGATTADHLVPRSQGGSDELSNLRPAHAVCNSVRQDMPLAQWWAGPGRAYLPQHSAARESRRWLQPPATSTEVDGSSGCIDGHE